jgi:hypothetical protein
MFLLRSLNVFVLMIMLTEIRRVQRHLAALTVNSFVHQMKVTLRLIRGVAFGGSGIIRGVAFGGSDLIKEGLVYQMIPILPVFDL